jgi:hypothetical protein
MSGRFIDLDQIPRVFSCTKDRVNQLIAQGKIHPIGTTRKTTRVRAGKPHRFTVQICRASRQEVQQALDEYRAWANQGEGLTNAEMWAALGISRTLWDGYKVKCDPLGGDPLPPPTEGRRDGRKVDLWPTSIRDQILAVFEDAKKGHVVISGLALLSTTRAVKRVQEARSSFCANSLYAYRNDRCPILGDRKFKAHELRLLPGKGLPELWWEEKDIEDLVRTLTALKEGRYVLDNGQERFTRKGAAKHAKHNVRTIDARRDEGLLEGESVPCWRGPRRKTKIYTEAELEEAEDKAQELSEGRYEGGNRVNVAFVAEHFGINKRFALALIKETSKRANEIAEEERRTAPDKPTTKERLGHNPKTKRRGHRPEHTILFTGVPLLREARRAELKLDEKYKSWKDTGKIAEHFDLTRPVELKALSQALPLMRAADPECCIWRTREKHGRLRRRWAYDPCRIERLLDGKTFAEYFAANKKDKTGQNANQPTGNTLLRLTAMERMASAARVTHPAADPTPARPPKSEKEPKANARRGRKKGHTQDWLDREKKLIEAWKVRQFGTKKARYAREFGFHRPDASRLINTYEARKRRKNSAP